MPENADCISLESNNPFQYFQQMHASVSENEAPGYGSHTYGMGCMYSVLQQFVKWFQLFCH